MNCRRQRRQRLCALIAQSENIETCRLLEALESLYEDQHSSIENGTLSVDNVNQILCKGDVTPLMVACDKSLEFPLIHLQRKIKELHIGCTGNDANVKKARLEDLVGLWGHPMEASSTSEGSNCAAHHALASGFAFGLEILIHFHALCEDYSIAPVPNDRKHAPMRHLEMFHSLLSQQNANGDTPIMMACAFGHTSILKLVLQKYVHLSIQELKPLPSGKNVKLDKSTVEQMWRSVQNIFEMRNKEGCSGLTLSCGHGKVETVKLLVHRICVCVWAEDAWKVDLLLENERIDACMAKRNLRNFRMKELVKVSYNDLTFCQSSLKNLESELKLMSKQKIIDKAHLEVFTEQRRKISECDQLLTSELQIASNAITKLVLDEKSDALPVQRVSKKKKKKKQLREIGKSATQSNEKEDNRWKNKDQSDVKSIKDVRESPFITLQDGRIISKGQNLEDMSSEQPEDITNSSENSDIAPSIQSVLKCKLREQCQPKEDASHNQRETLNIQAQMESLCLEPSMLLLSSHGMAINMSPCQLDAVREILMHQLNAAREAQCIQKRLLTDHEV